MSSVTAAFGFRGRLIATAVAGGMLLASPASAQNAPEPLAPAPVEAAPMPAPAPPAARPGLFEAIGRWIDRGQDTVRTHLRGAKREMDNFGDTAAESSREVGNKVGRSAAEATKGAVEVTKGAVEITKGAVEATRGAAEVVAKLPVTRVMRGHERCAVSANGAPDCQVAADALCRQHGYSSGKSMDFTSAEECSPRVLLSGRTSENECRTVTFISRAVCQ